VCVGIENASLRTILSESVRPAHIAIAAPTRERAVAGDNDSRLRSLALEASNRALLGRWNDGVSRGVDKFADPSLKASATRKTTLDIVDPAPETLRSYVGVAGGTRTAAALSVSYIAPPSYVLCDASHPVHNAFATRAWTSAPLRATIERIDGTRGVLHGYSARDVALGKADSRLCPRRMYEDFLANVPKTGNEMSAEHHVSLPYLDVKRAARRAVSAVDYHRRVGGAPEANVASSRERKDTSTRAWSVHPTVRIEP
jgi:hypothetical protein